MQTYGLIGFPVRHSLSPVMHNAAFKACGIDASYRLFELDPKDLEDFLVKGVAIPDIDGQTFSFRDIAGFNVTIPHKVRTYQILERKFPYYGEVSQMPPYLYYALLAGAVNTVKVVKAGAKAEYYNTDAAGFLRSLEEDLKFDAKGKEVVLLGCGGAGRAVIAGLNYAGLGVKKVFVYDVNSRVASAAEEELLQVRKHLGRFGLNIVEFITEKDLAKKIGSSQLLVDATGAGLKKEDCSPINKKLLHKDLSVYDLVYNKETRLLREAKERGCAACDGLGMLFYQAVLSFGIWTGKRDVEVEEAMRQALNQAVKG